MTIVAQVKTYKLTLPEKWRVWVLRLLARRELEPLEEEIHLHCENESDLIEVTTI